MFIVLYTFYKYVPQSGIRKAGAREQVLAQGSCLLGSQFGYPASQWSPKGRTRSDL